MGINGIISDVLVLVVHTTVRSYNNGGVSVGDDTVGDGVAGGGGYLIVVWSNGDYVLV